MKKRSIQWFGRQDIYGFIYRSWVKNRVPQDQFDGRPVIGICNTWSELTPCNTHFRVLAEHVRNGILEAGGFPLEFPVMSLGETLLRPTAMLYRNLAAMSVEESIRGNPLDGVVLLAGCDKTTPATLMGAASVDLPTILVSGGPMLSGKYRGTTSARHQHLVDVGGPARRQDHARGVPRGRIVHAPLARPLHDDGHRLDHGLDERSARRRHAGQRRDSRRGRAPQRARAHGRPPHRRDGEGELVLSKILRPAFENAIRALAAIGGSTNAVIHLIALARGWVELLEDFDGLAAACTRS